MDTWEAEVKLEGAMGRKEKEGETGRAEGNPSSSYCKRSATENSNAFRKVNKAACTL